MARWAPNGSGRLEAAALALFGERGFENTTVAEIAERAGLTERTFFRHFSDKREVLFAGAGMMRELLVSTIAAAPTSLRPLDAVAAAFEAATALLQERREFAKLRQRVILANAELRERELIKLSSWSAALADAVAARGVPAPEASLAAQIGMAAFRTAFVRWIEEPGEPSFTDLFRESLNQVRALITE